MPRPSHSTGVGLFTAAFTHTAVRRHGITITGAVQSFESEIIRHSLDCVCVHDFNGVILAANPAFLRAVEATSEEALIGRPIADLLDPRVAAEFPQYLERLRAQGWAEGQMIIRTATGARRVFEYRNTLEAGIAFAVARDVTEPLEAKRRLASSERWFRTLFEKSLGAVCITTLDGRFIDINAAVLRLLHAPSRQAVLQRNVDDFHVDAFTRADVLHRLRLQRELSMVEVAIRRFDGKVIWVAMNYVLADFGPPHGEVVLTTAVDITAQKEMEDTAVGRLRQSERDYRVLFEHSHDPLLVLEPLTERVLDANRAACATYGIDKTEFIGRSMLEFSRPDAAERTPDVLRARGAFIDFNTVQFGSSGDPIDLQITAGPITYRGAPAILSINRNVSEQRRAEEERRLAYARVSAIAHEWTATFDAVLHPIILVDDELRIRRANRAAATLLGCSVDQLSGTSLESRPSEPWGTISALCRGGTDVSVEVVGAEPERIWEISINTRQTADAGFIIILRDVTPMHELRRTLLRVETMSAMGALVAGVLHEVRNPLFSISATVDVLDAHLDGSASTKYTQRLRSDVARLQKVMNDLLDYGRPHTLNLLPSSLDAILSSAAAACQAASQAAGVHVQIACASIPLRVDFDRMCQVFQNVIENSLHHAPRGSTIRIAASEETRRGEDWVTIVVEDEGPGFPPAALAQIFEPFFSRRRGGTGLGLSIVRKIVEEHGGTIEAGNRAEGGARMRISLRART